MTEASNTITPTHLHLLRYTQGPKATAGLLFLNNVFQCYTLEDAYREPKVPGITRIPEGCYALSLRDAGGMAPKYNAKYQDINHRGMLWLRDVPGFKYIYLHIGNYARNTDGCILVGRQPLYDATLGYKLYRSTQAYKALYPKVVEAASQGLATISIQALVGGK